MKTPTVDAPNVPACATALPLAMAIENTGAVVVVSSDWRLFPSKFTELCRALKHRNIRVIGKTKPSVTEGARPLEIIRFLTTFHAKMKRQSKPFRIMRWLAVDDRQLPTEEGGEYMTPNKFTVTDSNAGLTFNIAMEIINKLNRTVHPPAKVCQNGNLGIGDSSG